MGAIFFSVGSLTRNLFSIYVQGILFLILWVIAQTLTKDLDNQNFAALIDPMGVDASLHIARFWTPAEKNSMVIPLTGALLYNRIIWTSLGILIFAIGYKFFTFSAQPISLFRKSTPAKPEVENFPKLKVPVFNPSFSFFNRFSPVA